MDSKRIQDKSCIFSRLLVTSPFAFCVITFEPIEVQTRSAPQNDRLKLSFVKDSHVDGRKLARNDQKRPFGGQLKFEIPFQRSTYLGF